MRTSIIIRICVVVLVLFGCSSRSFAQPKTPRSVAIFLYPGVELLDFAGPGEVFSAAGFDVFTMSVEGTDLVSQRFVTIKPRYSLQTAPTPDIVVFPGGGSGPTSENPLVMEWVKEKFSGGTFFMSVCTGASIIGNAGLLKNMNVTTWYGFIPRLQEMLPDSKVLEHTRFVDNGRIITTAGVSAGIDGALHLVSRIKGLDAALAAAKYMEYDKWDPKNGRIDRRNELIAQIWQEAEALEKKNKLFVIDETKTQVPYEGELKNLATDLVDAKLLKHAALVLEYTVKLYPNGTAYTPLSKVYAKLGKPAPMNEEELFAMIETGKVKEAIERAQKDMKAFPQWKGLLNEGRINGFGYVLLQKKKVSDAIALFRLNTVLYPTSSNAFDSLGEAYLTNEEWDQALVNYKKSLELDSGNDNAKQQIQNIENKIAGKS